MSERPNVLLITLDSLRPDHLGCYGYEATRTPNFDRMAAQGVRFNHAYCQAPNTWISHAALFTGSNPPRNGIRSPLCRLSAELATLAERFQAAGYRTFGLPSVSLLSHEAGFSRGFETYELGGLLSQFHGAAHFRDLQETLRLVREWLTSAQQPWFVWLHDFGIHVVQGTRAHGQPAEVEVTEEDRRRFSPFAQHYDAKIVYADREFLGPVFHAAQLQSPNRALVVALLSDHGDDLHAIECGRPGHDGGLHEQVVRVPLVLWAPQRLPAGVQVDAPVRVIDLYPTLLELAAIAAPQENTAPMDRSAPSLPPALQSQGSKTQPLPVDGISLVPLCHGDQEPLQRDVYFENLYQGYLGLRRNRHKLILSSGSRPQNLFRKHLGWRLEQLSTILLPDRLLRPLQQRRRQRSQGQQFQTPPAELCRQLLSETSRAELYDLTSDPAEQENLADQRPEIVSELRDTLRHLSSGGTAPPQAAYTADEEAEIHQRLSDLGYL